jgi:hypothetical protein
MFDIIVTKIAAVFFATAFMSGAAAVCLSPLIASATTPSTALAVLAAGQALALLGGAGWYCAEEDLHRAEWRRMQRQTQR